MKLLLIISLLITTVISQIPLKDYKPNVFVLTDISNEPDDAESLVRLLLYTNEINLHGIVATTSQWLNTTTHEEDISPVLEGYEQVYENLIKHSDQYPTADYLRSIVKKGHGEYGSLALENNTLSSGAEHLIQTIDQLKDVDDYLYILVWGGANVLAETLKHLSENRSKEEVDSVISKLSVYTISDQDNTGPWIRFTYPKLRYIASIHAFNHYRNSAWIGISGEETYNFDKGGPDGSWIAEDWVKEHIQDVGPLGEHYLDKAFIYEGDTPTTFSVLPNGLNVPSHPEYGGWGGRYGLIDASGAFNHYADVEDHVIGINGDNFTSSQATVWRWRPEYQSDFAARMQWTVKDFNETYHEPIIVANETQSVLPFIVEARLNSTVVLDVSQSYDLNGHDLEFEWFHYREATSIDSRAADVVEIEIRPLNTREDQVEFTIPSFDDLCLGTLKTELENCKENHIIVKVSNGKTSSYRRFLVKALKE
ncbi:putative secreted protein [Wickerhamomyces ciferrii]|uniref:Secreted protein n=1 Tax=Wickerhamomyces ciferrii (strain ATCC 14091 / BCRC 22168 / CBS 111 / JCM 3599 / NBRC 0793 / NRRL Y-1031 F-60-10) TaxID=1206466 RepID=K0KPQ9_WICCF|nr:uncharacterized protein BN7_2932 [Wickerhamomyces ciferrii]CCH43384.1 putative secreted protein [Wickerhamomyces ciferrii]